MRPTIVFSSSDSSEYEDDEMTPANTNINNNDSKNINKNVNEGNYSVSSDDYSSEIVVVRKTKPNNLIKRPIVTPKKSFTTLNTSVKVESHKIQLDDFDSSYTESSNSLDPNKKTVNSHETQFKQKEKINIESKKEEGNDNKKENEDIYDDENKIESMKDSDFEYKNESNFEEIKEKDTNEEEEDLNPPVIKMKHIKTNPSITFALFRKLKSSLRGKRYYYYFYSNGNPVFCAKTKNRHPDSNVLIYEGTKAHIKGESQYLLVTNQESTIFSLKKCDKLDEEMLTLKFFYDSALLNLPKHIDIQIFPCIGISKMSLTTKKPKVSSRGNWILDFHDKFTIPSEKNMIFVPSKDKNGPDLLLVRKISPDGMEIDSYTNIPEVGIFAIGLSIFLAKFR